MDILKSVLIAFLITIALSTSGQVNSDVYNAMKESYTLEAEGKYEEAIKELKKVYDEDSYEINIRLGYLKYLSGSFSESIPYYKRCITLKPLSIEARMGLVMPNSALGNWTVVINTYNEILEFDDFNPIALYRLGVIYYGKEDYTKALGYFDQVLNRYPFDYDTIIMAAWTHFKMGEMRKAKVLFNKALLYNPDDESAQEGLSLIK